MVRNEVCWYSFWYDNVNGNGNFDRYFEWRTKYEIVERPRDGWCDLCRFLHDDSLPAKSYEDIVEWWAGRTCLATPTFWGQPPRTVFSFSKVNMVKVLQKLLSSQ